MIPPSHPRPDGAAGTSMYQSFALEQKKKQKAKGVQMDAVD